MGKNRSCNHLAGKSFPNVFGNPAEAANLGSVPSYSLAPSVAPKASRCAGKACCGTTQPTRQCHGGDGLPSLLSHEGHWELQRLQKLCSASLRRAYMEGAARAKGQKNDYRKQIGYQQDLFLQ